MSRASFFLIVILVIFPVYTYATIINIPADYPAIQQGIDASVDGDTVLVRPGTYVENINFNGHNIVLGSLFLMTGDTSYVSQTIIDGAVSGPIVTFVNGETTEAVIQGFSIIGGSAINGGGVYCNNNSSPTISNNTISENTCIDSGAGICCYSSSPTITNNIIKNNHALPQEGGGGGIACINSSPLIECNIIYGNYAYIAGGGIGCRDNSNPRIINNTIYGNSTGPNYGGGGLVCINSNPQVSNTIFWGNEPQSILGNDPFVSYCNVQGGWPGIGNIDIDPLFRDPANGDFHLMSTACGDPYDSPCIDAGDPNILDSLLDCSWGLGTPRSDMGAYGGGDSAMVGILENLPPLPSQYLLLQNYPNPFNATTKIRFILSEPHEVTLTIYDLLGRQIKTLIDEHKQAGIHSITFDASDLSSGVYFYRLQAGDVVETKRMVLLK